MIPPLPVLAAGALGYLAFGAVGTFLRPGGPGAAASVLLPLAAVAGAAASTLPSLLVGRRWLGLPGAASEVARAHLETLARGGALALALAPVLAFFSTSGRDDLYALLYGLALLGLCGATFLATLASMPEDGARGRLLGAAWLALSACVALAVHARLGGA